MLSYIKGNKITWRDVFIQGKKSQYRVSNEGDIKDRYTKKSLDQTSNRDGSLVVSLEYKDKILRVRVHQLVARAFIPNPEGWLCVHHKDGNKSNNDVNNLEWDRCRGWM